MSAPQNVIAVIFDFDDTLTDDSTTQLLTKYGIDAEKFWSDTMQRRVKEGWDPSLAYLSYITEQCSNGGVFAGLSNADLRTFGGSLKFYPGLSRLFSDLKKLAATYPLSHPCLEFYIISGGLEEVIRGSSIAQHMTGIRGCRFEEKDGAICAVKNVVSFTEKTRFVFEINKGFFKDSQRDKPYDVNKKVEEKDRRIPLSNMIYIGDGLTDVPCFSLLTRNGGKGIGVFDPAKSGSPKKAWEQLVAPHRIDSIHSPKYGPKDDLGSLLRAAISAICLDIELGTQTVFSR